MRLFLITLIFSAVASAQNKKINFFGTEFRVNNQCEVKESSVKYGKNALVWTDAPPLIMRGTMTSIVKDKLAGKNLQEVKTDHLKIMLLKNNWKGKMTQYKKAGNDSILNFVQLYGNYKAEERMLIMMYKTPKQEPFRIPAYFGFLVD